MRVVSHRRGREGPIDTLRADARGEVEPPAVSEVEPVLGVLCGEKLHAFKSE
jgi:hypothetical protein